MKAIFCKKAVLANISLKTLKGANLLYPMQMRYRIEWATKSGLVT